MNSLKTAIVGAGICGLYLAWKLSQRGYNVTVFEKKEKIGKQACSGLFSERILEFIPDSEKLIQNKIDSVLIHFPRRTIRIKFSKRFLVMSHFELDNLVAGLAAASGAKIILNHPVNSLPEGFSRIIGCDGPDSVIRKSLGLGNPVFRLAIQGFIPVKEDKSSFSPFTAARVKEDYSPTEDLSEVKKKEFSSSFVETWPVKNGFIWKIPRGKEVEEDKSSSSPFANAQITEYGIIANPHEAKNIFEDFLAKNRISLSRMTAAIVPQGFIIPKNSLITLCGDATGLTKPWSGGGVIWGLMSSEILLKNFPDFLKYQKELKKFFLPKIILSGIATKMAYFLGLNLPWFLPKNVTVEGDFLI